MGVKRAISVQEETFKRSKWRPGYWLRHPLTSLVTATVAALIFLAMALQTASETARLNAHGISASATILEVHAGRDSYVVASYMVAEGYMVTARVSDYYMVPRPEVGDAGTVIYDPADPYTVRDARMGGDYFGSWLLAVLGLILGVGGSWFLWRTWRVWYHNAQAWLVYQGI